MSLSLDKGTSLEIFRWCSRPPKEISVLAALVSPPIILNMPRIMLSIATEKQLLTDKDRSCYLSILYIILVINIVLFIFP